jgi:hypothetical protein
MIQPVKPKTNDEEYYPVPLTSTDLLTTEAGREFILIGGKDGVGKTSALISIAMVVNGKVDNLDGCVIFNPAAKVYVLDTEHKFASVYRQFGANAPDNIALVTALFLNWMRAVAKGILKGARGCVNVQFGLMNLW